MKTKSTKIKRKSINFIFRKYIKPNKFSIKDYIYYDITKYTKYCLNNEFNDIVNLNDDEIFNLKSLINQIGEIKKTKEEIKTISITKDYFKKIQKYNNTISKLSNDEQIIKLIIDNSINNFSISCRKISDIFYKITNKKISKAKVHRILVKKLNYKYLKTCLKNRKLLDENYIKMKKIFIKIILRALKLKFYFIYVDESKIQTYNNNYRCWRPSNKIIYSKQNDKQKINLIMGVSSDKVVHYSLSLKNTDSSEFIKFLSEMKKKIPDDLFKRTLFIFDNAKFHTSLKTEKYLRENKFNILTIVPYMSQFDSIELTFRYIKNILYKKIFSSIEQIKEIVKEIIESDELKNSLKYQFKETLLCYLNNI